MSTSKPSSFFFFIGFLVDNEAPVLDADDEDGSADLSTGNTADATFVAPKRAVAVADATEDFVPAVPVRDEDGDKDGLADDTRTDETRTEDVVAVSVDDDDADSLVTLPDDGSADLSTGNTADATFVAPKRAVADAVEDFVPAVPVRDEDGLADDTRTADVVAVPADDDYVDSLVTLPDDDEDDTGGTANADAGEKPAVMFAPLTQDEEARGESVAGLYLHTPLLPLLCALTFLAFSC